MSSDQQQQKPLSPVWFLLLDSASGKPYKGTTSEKVFVSSSADVADFRKAAYLENSSILTGITLDYHGKTEEEEDMLVVVVPSCSSQPLVPNLWRATGSNALIYDGLPGLHSAREETVAGIIADLKNVRSVLFSAPPFSGKTFLADLVCGKWISSGNPAYWFPCVSLRKNPSYNDFLKVWDSDSSGYPVKISFEEAIRNSSSLIVLDDAHMSYGIDELWKHLKTRGKSAPSAHILACSTFLFEFDSSTSFASTPFGFGIRHSAFAFTEVEYDEFVNLLNVKFNDLFTAPVVEFVKRLCGFHTGMTAFAFGSLQQHYKAERGSLMPEELETKMILSENILVQACRMQTRNALPKFDSFLNLYGEQAPRVYELFRAVLADGSCNTTDLGFGKLYFILGQDFFRSLCRCNVFVQNGTVLSLPSRFHYRYYENELFMYCIGKTPDKVFSASVEIADIILSVLKMFRLDPGKEYLSVGVKGNFKEDYWHQEMYRCLNLFFYPKVHSEVGAFFGSRGSLDLYINSDLQLGFELLIAGDRLQMHIDRFLPGGIYDKIPLKKFAIVDFCEAGKVSRYKGETENYYRIDVDWENCKFTLIYGSMRSIIDFNVPTG